MSRKCDLEDCQLIALGIPVVGQDRNGYCRILKRVRRVTDRHRRTRM
jgi:hypothetical protein